MRFDVVRSPKGPRTHGVWKVLLLLALVVWAMSTAQAQKVTDSLTTNRPQTGAEQSRNGNVRQQPSQSRSVTALRRSETPQGSRLSLISDGTLNDYSAYRMGDRFFIIIPRARAPVRQSGSGQGFEGLRVEPRGNDLLLSFRVPEGRSARVSQRFNKLDILLESSGASTSASNSNNDSADARNKNANRNEAEVEEAAAASTPEVATAEVASTDAAGDASTSTGQTTAGNETAQAQQGPASTTAPPVNPAPAGAPVGTAGATSRNWFPILLLTVLLLALIGLLWFGHSRQQPNNAAPDVAAQAGTTSAPELEERSTLAASEALPAELASRPAEETDDEEEDALALEEDLLSRKIEDNSEIEIDDEMEAIDDASLIETVETEETGAALEQASLQEELPIQADSNIEQLTEAAPRTGELEREAALAVDDASLLSDHDASFDDPAEEVRNRAARDLYDQRADRVGAFTSAIREADTERRRRIGAAMSSSGVAAECIGQLTGSSSENAIEAFSLLFLMLKAGEIEPLLTAVAKHPETEVRLAVVRLFALSENAELLPLLRRLSAQGALPVAVRSALKQTIYQLGNQNGG